MNDYDQNEHCHLLEHKLALITWEAEKLAASEKERAPYSALTLEELITLCIYRSNRIKNLEENSWRRSMTAIQLRKTKPAVWNVWLLSLASFCAGVLFSWFLFGLFYHLSFF